MARLTRGLTLNMFNILCVAWLFVSIPTLCFASEYESSAYPQFSDLPTYIYDDYLTAYERVFREEATPYWWAIGFSTAALLAADDTLIRESKRIGRQLGLSDGDRLKTYLTYRDQAIFRAPTDLGSALYYIGDGWTHAAIAAGFLATGSWADDEQTYAVGFELVEGMIATTIATQFLKHVTGHETPNHATSPKGEWDFFPNQRDYADCVPCYDAFPSGHVAVSTMTLTVLHNNYPDNPWIMPTGVTLISLLAFQMMNNGVHWASDYPLAIGLGYVFGEIAFERGQSALASGKESSGAQWLPLVNQDSLGMTVHYQF